MKNSEQPAYPTIMQKVGDKQYRASKQSDPKEYNIPCAGLTKREMFAAMAMQGLLLHGHGNSSYVAVNAIKHADALLAELDKTNSHE